MALCALWFHPLVWITGSRLALYRELSCDESVIQSGHGRDLVSALAKLANPEEPTDGSAADTGKTCMRVDRGGSWYYPTWLLRPATRERNPADYRDGIMGFRVARALP
jgi:hypothetical protein